MTNCKFCNEKVSLSEDTSNDDEHVNCRNEAERRKETNKCLYCNKSMEYSYAFCDDCVKNKSGYTGYPGP